MPPLTRLTTPLLLGLVACAPAAPEPPVGRSSASVELSDGWVGTWAAAPHADGTSFNDQTLRQVVHTSIGGASLRVRLSNAFGKQALQLDNAHVAERANGSSIVAGSDRPLLFAGQTGVSIPAGQSLLSDAVAFTVEPLSDIVVSFHVAGTPGGTTAHGTGLQDNYVAAGNVSGNQALSGAQVKGSYYFLSAVDVQNPAAWGAVVTLGASITDGVASGGNANRRWPNDLAQRLNDAKLPVGVLNQGISGNRLLADGSGESALKRFERDVLEHSGVRWVIFSDDPINDLGSGNPPSGAQLIDGLKQLVQKAHAADVEFWCSTLTPYEGSGGWKPAGETARAAIISFIKQPDSGCDQIVDQDTATHDPAKPTWFLPANDAGDHLHPNEKGLQAIADAVPLAAFEPLPGAGGSGGAAGSSAVSGSAGVAGDSSAGANQGGDAGNGPSPAAGHGGTSYSSAGSAGSPAAGGSASSGAGMPNVAGSSTTSAAPADSGCGCRTARGESAPLSIGGLLLTALLAGARRRRRQVTKTP